MALPDDQLIAILRNFMTPIERDTGVVYAAAQHLADRTTLHLGGTTIVASSESVLAFIDRDPMANWGHSCRYVLIGCQTGETNSFEAQFPPFGQEGLTWRVIYKAPTVPDAVLAQPR